MDENAPITVGAAARALDLDRSNLNKAAQRGQLWTDADGLTTIAAVRRYRGSIYTRPTRRKRRPQTTPAPCLSSETGAADRTVSVYAEDGRTVVARIAASDVLEEYGGDFDALDAAADADGFVKVSLVSLSEVIAHQAKATADALAATPGDRVRLDHLSLEAPRADAEALLAVYRCGSGTDNLAVIRALHQRLGVKSS